jgi:hypothetical protein
MLLKVATSVTSLIIKYITGNKSATNWQQPVTSFIINNFHSVKWHALGKRMFRLPAKPDAKGRLALVLKGQQGDGNGTSAAP